MAISFVVAAGATTNVVAIPASATNGDCIIVQAVNTASTTFSASPTGCTTITRRAAGSGSFLLAYTFKSAGSAANISAVGATHIGLSVYRGTSTPTPVGAFTTSSAALDTLIDVGALTFTVTDGSSWGIGGYFHNRTTDIGQPVGMVERFDNVSTSRAAALSDTNAGQTTFTAHTATATAGRDWASITVELLALVEGNRTVTAEVATYTHAGQSILFGVAQPSNAAGFSEAGQDVQFDIFLTADAGSFALAGQDVVLSATGQGSILVAETGAYVEAGQAVMMAVSMPSDMGALSEAGQDVGLDVTMPAAAGAFALAGQDVTLTDSTPTSFTLVAEAAAFAVGGQVVVLDSSVSDSGGEATPVYVGAGGGHAKRASEDFWEIREEYLKRLKAEAEEVVPHETVVEIVTALDQGIPAVQAITEAVAQRERAYRAAEAARTTAELNAEATKIIRLTQEIAKLKTQKDEDDAILMLLMVL